MHIYQGERDLQDKNQALAIPGGFQVDKDIAMSSGQFYQVWNSFNTTLCNNPSYSRILIGSRLWSIRGQFWELG